MGQADWSNSSGPVRDRNAGRVCNLAGLKLAQDNLVTLQEINRGTEIALRELEAERDRARFVDKTFLVLKFTRATCDAFIDLAANFTGVLGKRVKKSYKIAGTVADTAARAATGQDVNYADAGWKLYKDARPAFSNPVHEFGLTMIEVKVDIVKSALNKNEKGVQKSAGDYMTELTKFTIEEAFRAEFGEKAGEKAGKVVDIGKTMFDYHQAIGEAFDEAIENSLDTEMRYIDQRMTIIRSAKGVRKAVESLERFVNDCSKELESTKPPAPGPIEVLPPT